MSEPAFTPGPWMSQGKVVFVVVPGHMHRTATVAQVASECDSPIIAAAPDMYAACKIFLAQCRCVDIHHHGFGAAFDAACAAIAKAEGRT